jgi:hypothetical protein
MGKDKRQTTTQTLDPSSQGYVNGMRGAGRAASDYVMNAPGTFIPGTNQSIDEILKPFMDPYMGQVIGGVRGEFDHLRSMARRGTTDAAIQSGAYNGGRHGVAEGVRLGELDRAQTSQISGLLSSGFQNAMSNGLAYSEYQRALRERQAQEGIMRRQVSAQFLTGGMGPVGSESTQVQRGNIWADLAGAGLIGLGFMGGGPAGAAAAATAGGGPSFSNPTPGTLPGSNVFSPNWQNPFSLRRW